MNNAKFTSPDRRTYFRTLADTTLNLSRLYRAHIESHDSRGVERTAYVDAFSHNCACKKIAAVIAALEHRQPAEVADRIYNCYSAQELIDEGLSEDIEIRLFETGWSGGRAMYFVENPLFLVGDPAPLLQAWLKTRAPATEAHPALSRLQRA